MFQNTWILWGLTFPACFISCLRTGQFNRYDYDGYFSGVSEDSQTISVLHCAALCQKRAGCLSFAVHRPMIQGDSQEANCRTSNGDGEFVMNTEWRSYVLTVCNDNEDLACQTWSIKETTTAVAPPTTSVRPTCPPDFEVVGAGCYKYHVEPKTWSAATQICKSENGHLLRITSQAEQNQVSIRAGGLRGQGVNFYGGGQYNPTAGIWQTDNGLPLEYTHWKGDSPSGSSTLCLMILAYPGKWSSDSCDVTHEYMCEIDIF